MTRSRSKPQGRAHRERIRRLIVPKLRVGCRVPTSATLGRFLGVCQAEGYRHMKRVLEEDGIVTRTMADCEGRRIYVVFLPKLSPQSPKSYLSPLSASSNRMGNGVDGTSSYAEVGP